MATVVERDDENGKAFEWFQIFGRLGVSAATYPFDYVKILIQIGHEPLPLKATHTLFGKPALAYPGVFTYMKHIRQVDGFFGLYRGIFPKLCTGFISLSSFTVIYEKLPDFFAEDLKQKSENELTDEEKLTVYAHELLKSSIARCVTIVISHPFHVVTIRTIAQFVGREENYRGIISSLLEIYKQDGLLGFFSGLIPRLIGENLTIVFATVISVLINTYLVEEESLKGYVRTIMSYLSSALFYPFTVVCHSSIVNDCGLQAGVPPNMPIYVSWTDCWSHLSAINQLKRGSSVLWRYYNGPLMKNVYKNPPPGRVFAQAFPHSILKHIG